MVLQLYFDILSQPSRALLILLQRSNIPFEQCSVALRKGEHLTETFKNNVSRFGKVPVIKDGEYVLTESVAILRYLARGKQLPDQWYPKDTKLQARVDEYLEWQHIGFRIPLSMCFRVKWLDPLITGEESHPKRVASYEKKMCEALNDFEKLWLAKSKYIVGDQLSAADLWAACELEQIRIAGYDPEIGRRPRLHGWLNDVRTNLNPHYNDAHVLLNKLVAKGHEAFFSKL